MKSHWSHGGFILGKKDIGYARTASYFGSNVALYRYNLRNRGCGSEISWIKCNAPSNYHILSYAASRGQPRPDPNNCWQCKKEAERKRKEEEEAIKKEVDRLCSCAPKTLMAIGCKCGGK